MAYILHKFESKVPKICNLMTFNCKERRYSIPVCKNYFVFYAMKENVIKLQILGTLDSDLCKI